MPTTKTKFSLELPRAGDEGTYLFALPDYRTSPEMYGYNAANALMLERKADMKRRGIPSPDVADAFALTFAYTVARWEDEPEEERAVGRSAATGY